MSEDGNNAGIIRGVDRSQISGPSLGSPKARSSARVPIRHRRQANRLTFRRLVRASRRRQRRHQPLNRRPVQARTILSADAQMETDWRSK